MIIIFGLHLDSQRSWRKRDAFGHLELGPSGLLSQLEQYLGLSSPPAVKLHRLIHYRSILQRLDNGSRFYSRSMQVDDFGVASALLDMRDDLYLHGWDGSYQHRAVSRRLSDLVEIERALGEEEGFEPCNGERLMLVLEALTVLRTPITVLRLLEPLDHHPRRWQEVIRLLPFSYSNAFDRPLACEGSSLACLQKRLLTDSQSASDPEDIADASIRVLTADTALTAAYYTTATLSASADDVLLVHDGKAGLLDDVLAAEHFPQQAFSRSSSSRPALQLLPLALRLTFRPLDISALLAFLTLPAGINPVHPVLRERIVSIVSRYPGIGGEAWVKTLNEFRNGGEEHADSGVKSFLEWVDGATQDRHDGMTSGQLIAVTCRVTNFFDEQVKSLSDDLLKEACSTGLEQASDFLSALETIQQHGTCWLSIYQIEQLLSKTGEKSSRKSLYDRQAGSVPDASCPGGVCEPSSHVFWWWMAAPLIEQGGIWSSRERAFLEGEGIVFPSQEQKLLWQEEEWKRPVLAARHSLTLLLPPDETQRHPLWMKIASLFPSIPVMQIEYPQTTGIVCTPIVRRPLVACKPFWSVPGFVLGKKQSFSPTSLEKLIADPCQWFLEYEAKLSPSKVLDVSDGPRLYGLLFHRMVQKLCPVLHGGSVTMSSIDAWFDECFAILVKQEGAVLLMEGRNADLEGLRLRIRHALHHLVPVLERQGARSVVAEQRLDGRFAGGNLYGYIDILLHDDEARPSVIDMKWGGGTRRRQNLAAGTHLQLLVYAWLVYQKTGRWPALAYFIASRAELLTDTAGFFVAGNAVRTENDESAELLWERVLASFTWRMEQIEAGRLAVSCDREAGDEDVSPPEALKPLFASAMYNPYRFLVGWGECS